MTFIEYKSHEAHYSNLIHLMHLILILTNKSTAKFLLSCLRSFGLFRDVFWLSTRIKTRLPSQTWTHYLTVPIDRFTILHLNLLFHCLTEVYDFCCFLNTQCLLSHLVKFAQIYSSNFLYNPLCLMQLSLYKNEHQNTFWISLSIVTSTTRHDFSFLSCILTPLSYWHEYPDMLFFIILHENILPTPQHQKQTR